MAFGMIADIDDIKKDYGNRDLIKYIDLLKNEYDIDIGSSGDITPLDYILKLQENKKLKILEQKATKKRYELIKSKLGI